MKRLLIIVGPTASGKTQQAIELAQRLETEIISCDSRQFYSELNIGVARPTPSELTAVKHHFIACRTVCEPYNIWQYAQEAQKVIDRLFEEHDSVVAVGGSGLYIDALCGHVCSLPDPTPELRAALQRQIAEGGLPELLNELKEKDPKYYESVDRKNPIRIQRALEVIRTTNRPYSQIIEEQQICSTDKKKRSTSSGIEYEIQKIGIYRDRQLLRQRINNRIEIMLQQGLVEEAYSLLPYRNYNTLNTVGYKELFHYFDNKKSLKQAIVEIENHTWQYAKKQLTWLKRYPDLQWIDVDTKKL